MYIIVLPCEMVLANKFRGVWFVPVMNVSLLDVPFSSFLFNVARLSLYGSDEEPGTLTYNFARERRTDFVNSSVRRCVEKKGGH